MKWAKSYSWILAVVAGTFEIHEASHGVSARLLGYEPYVRINSSGLETGQYRSQWEDDVTTAAGPLVTIIQGAVGTALAVRYGRPAALTVVGASLLMRVLAAVASLRLPNDEARLGLSWGVGYWTVHAVVVVVLLAMFVASARALRASPASVVFVLTSICVSMVAVVVAEPYLPVVRF